MTALQLTIRLSRVLNFSAAAAFSIVLVLVAVVPPPAQAQAYKVLYSFTGGQDGSSPFTALTMDAKGNLYGTTYQGGNIGGNCKFGCGTVFKLTRRGSAWLFNTLYVFQGGSDGSYPYSRVIFGTDGGLYGTTWAGGGQHARDWATRAVARSLI